MSDPVQPIMSQSEFEKQPAVTKALIIAEQAKQLMIEDLESDPTTGHLVIFVKSQMDQLINRFAFLTGQSVNTLSFTKNEFPPITNFMGEEIHGPKKIEAAELDPNDVEKEKYLARVQKLYDELHTLDPYSVIDDYSIPEDQAVLRGVAFRAGIQDAETREINVKFIEDTLAGINQIAEDKKEDDRINQELANRQEAEKLTGDLSIARTKYEAVIKDLEEAQSSLEKATTDKQKDGRQKKVESISDEASKAAEYIKSLEEQIEKLSA